MPKIIKNEDQINACKEISSMLEEVKALNQAILSEKNDVFTIGFGRKKSVSLDVSLNDKLISVLKLQRAKHIKNIHTRASKYHIELDEDERMAICEEAISPFATPDAEAAPDF